MEGSPARETASSQSSSSSSSSCGGGGAAAGFDAVVIGSGYGGSVAACRLSEAGLKVCLLEKGRQWEAGDFPRNFWNTFWTTRWNTPYGNAGPSDALYQLHFSGGVLAVTGTGLGGGSLINGGVVLPTPRRARNDRRWPAEWNHDWHASESRARTMLQPESPPLPFPNSRVVDAVSDEIEDCTLDKLSLSVCFDNSPPYASRHPADQNSPAAPQMSINNMSPCTACGSCFNGCPYNAKKSVDRNYISAAIQAGAVVQTRCQARFVLPNYHIPGHNTADNETQQHQRRRWRVYLDELNYITADYVVISAGVVGSSNILFQSKLRGLPLSDKLGHGFSCNGNKVAFVCGTHVATKAYSISTNAFANTPVFDRPGPSITRSYTSSLGFTIQGAVLSNGFSFLFFKVIAHRGFWFGLFYGVWHKLKRLLKTQNSDSLILTMMGHDAADGRVEFDTSYHGFTKFFPPTDALIPKKISTVEKIAKRIGGQMFIPTLHNTTVHLLGGCIAAKSSKQGVVNSSGQVFWPDSCLQKDRDDIAGTDQLEDRLHQGLYVCDASVIPCAVGVNPSFTITAVAEHISHAIVQDALKKKKQELSLGSPSNAGNHTPDYRNAAGARVWETLSGKVEGLPCKLELVVDMGHKDRKVGILKGSVGGRLSMRSIEDGLLHIIDGSVDMSARNARTPFTQYMHYQLLLTCETGALYVMRGKKEMRPFMFGATAFEESRTLQVELCRLRNLSNGELIEGDVVMRGSLKVSYIALLRSLISMRGPRRFQFVSSLLLSLLKTYLFARPCAPHDKDSDLTTTSTYAEPGQSSYPSYTIHNITTDDGARISCLQWLPQACSIEETEEHSVSDENRKCALLLNGYSGESFYLPTEEIDLVRTLLDKGYEVWVLRMRLHFSVCTTTPFSLDDIAQYDIPAAFSTIAEVREKQEPIHVVAHCIGGLTIHMAILGGYVPSTLVASLTCTNSSMYFDVTKLAMLKLFLPLIPISIMILGKNNILEFSESHSESWRHRLLKSICSFIPRLESCTCKECNLFNALFGNAFWHENLCERLHYWLSKESLVKLPAMGFLQLRRICKAGHVVSRNGKDRYMPFIGRLAVPTTYISGGRPLLVTPTTTERAHALMQRHHPQLRHSRHVVPGYGHSDLYIGQAAPTEVFPLILESIASSSITKASSSSSSPSSSPSYLADSVARQTWVVPPSKSVTFLWQLRFFTLVMILAIVLFFIL